ncbi:MAG: hypothetical protein HC841_02200, partial [Verrucomicrobiae bacterium]|nr:hypothetical protein [Verrucomicrobiae bacterium]
IASIAFSPNGETIASGSRDETVKLWDVRTGDCMATIRAQRPYEGTDITGATGLADAQRTALKTLGAIDGV